MNLASRLVNDHAAAVVTVFVLVAVIGGALTDFRIGHSYTDWIDTAGEPYRRYAALSREFGSSETLLAVFELRRLERATNAGYFALIERLRSLDGVLGVYEPAGALLGASADYPPDPGDIDTLRDALERKPADFRSAIISRDTTTAAVLVLLDPELANRHAAVLEAVRTGFSTLGIPVDLGGTVYFSETLKQAIATDMARVNTLLMIVAIGLLGYFFRSVVLALCVACGIGLSVLYALAACMALGLTINLLTLLLLPLVFCVGLTTAVHLFSRRAGGRWDYAYAIHHIARPATIAAVTTALGCAAFAAAPQPVIARMGIVLPCGVLFSFVSTVLFVPSLLRLVTRGRPLPPLRDYTPAIAPRGRRRVGIALVMLALGAAALLPRITLNPDAMFFFADDSPVIRSYARIERDLTGMLVADLVIRAVNDGDTVVDDANTAKVRHVIDELRRIPEMSAVVSGYGLQRLTRFAGPAALLGGTFFSADERATRITLRIRNLGGRPYDAIAADVAAIWAAADTRGLAYELSGTIPLILEAQDHLLALQSVLLPLVVGTICAILFAVFRSARMLALAVAANFIPLLVTAGAMVWLAIPINSINLFVSSVMIGVIVDDTVHLLHAYRVHGSMDAALAAVGPAIWITSVIVGLAFASLIVSELVPIREFGLLSAIAVGSAWLCDVCLLPTLAPRGRVTQ